MKYLCRSRKHGRIPPTDVTAVLDSNVLLDI